MGLFDRLFGKRQETTADSWSAAPIQQQSKKERPFDYISEAIGYWEGKQPDRAEPLFRQGLEAYRRHEPDGVDFALDRYGAFLVDQGQCAKAAPLLAEAIQLGTDIPAVWGSYVQALTQLGREDQASEALKAAIDRGSQDVTVWLSYADLRAAANDAEGLVETGRGMRERKVLPADDTFEILLRHARKASREGRADFAEAVARGVIEEARQARNRKSRWAAVSDLGEILERVSRVDEAMELWAKAFGEGSDDAVTANRLTMCLEWGKDYEEASRIIREALTRGLPANVDEQLRKRLARCDGKPRGVRKAPDVDAFSIRHGQDRFELRF